MTGTTNKDHIISRLEENLNNSTHRIVELMEECKRLKRKLATVTKDYSDLLNEEQLSDCCAVPIPDYNECDLCPSCGEHCGVLEE